MVLRVSNSDPSVAVDPFDAVKGLWGCYKSFKKNKIRLLAVKTLDSTQKTHRIDDSKDVKRIVMSVCQKLAIKEIVPIFQYQ